MSVFNTTSILPVVKNESLRWNIHELFGYFRKKASP